MAILSARACLILGVGAGSYRSNNLHHIHSPVRQSLGKFALHVTGAARAPLVEWEWLTLVNLNPSITFWDIKGTIPSLWANISSGIGEVFWVNSTWSIPASSISSHSNSHSPLQAPPNPLLPHPFRYSPTYPDAPPISPGNERLQDGRREKGE